MPRYKYGVRSSVGIFHSSVYSEKKKVCNSSSQESCREDTAHLYSSMCQMGSASEGYEGRVHGKVGVRGASGGKGRVNTTTRLTAIFF